MTYRNIIHTFNCMVKCNSADLDAVFSALGDPTRRAILARLALGETCVSELAAPYQISLPAVSRHLRVLENAGLLKKKRDGKAIRCSLNPRTLEGAADWVDQYRHFWEGRFDQLARFLEGPNSPDEDTND